MSTRTDEQVRALFGGLPHPLAEPLREWLASSRQFALFANTFESKIRKKLRSAHDEETLLDLRLELETAFLLLGERTLNLEYEPLPPAQGRSPDFAVTYTTSTTFMLEVTRLRPERSPADGGAPPTPPLDRLIDTVVNKLGQLLAQRSNVLVIGAGFAPSAVELGDALVRLQQRVERNDVALLQRHHIHDRAAFFQRYQRLSELVVRTPGTQAGVVTWANPQARQPLPGKVRTAVRNALNR